MATRRNPRFKECRRLGVNVCVHPKAMKRADAPAFRKTHKVSEYGRQLIEKQKVKAYYGILEKQLRNYYAKAQKKEGKTGEVLLSTLECRLDNLVYRLGIANSIRMARQLVTHRHITVDGNVVNFPSTHIKVGQVVALKEKDRKNAQFKKCFLEMNKSPLPYLERDDDNFCGKLIAYPQRKDIPVEINDQMVVEFYSK